jgi:hypothetical protein
MCTDEEWGRDLRKLKSVTFLYCGARTWCIREDVSDEHDGVVEVMQVVAL